MAPADTSVAAVLDPSTLPQVAFARADDLLTSAAQLRAKAEILKSRAKEHEAKAKQFEDSAAELQVTAEEDRDHVQAELDNTLDYHGDVLEHFLLMPENEEELKRLTTSVEEGRAYMHEVMALGEKLLQVKAAKLQSSQQARQTSLTGLSETEGRTAPGHQIASQILAPLRPLASSAASTKSWQKRFHSLFGRRVPDVDDLAYASLIQPKTGEGSDEAQKEINASIDKVKTHDYLGPETSNIAKPPSTRSDTSVNSISTEVLQNAILPIPGQSVSIEAGPRGQKSRKMKNVTAEDATISFQDVCHSHVDEGSIPQEPSETDSPKPKKLKRDAPDSEMTVPNAGRLKRARKPTTREKAAAFKLDKAMTGYRELLASGTRKEKARKIFESEIKKKIENSSNISGERKERLFDYGRRQIRAMAKRETNRAKDATTTERGSKLEVTEEERTAFFNEPNTVARYRELFAAAKGNDWDKRAKAKKLLKKEMDHSMQSISKRRKPVVFMYVKQQINAMAKRETNRMLETHPEAFRPRRMNELDEMPEPSEDDAMVKGETERGGSAKPEDLFTAELIDEAADNAVETGWSERRQYAQLEDLYAAELSDESADEAMWP